MNLVHVPPEIDRQKITFQPLLSGDSVSKHSTVESPLVYPTGTAGLAEVVNVQFVLCSLYILLGMAVIAMCFSLMQEKVVQGVRSIGRKIGIVRDD